MTGPEPAPRLDLTLRVPLRDGRRLTAALYRPPGTSAPAAVLITPYGVDRHHAAALALAKRGYAVVLANSRGRFGSDGDFVPFESEGEDLSDVVGWTANQLWCDGQVVTFGGSYSGFAQWSMLRSPPAGLAALAPAAAVNPCADFPLGGNIHRAYALQWLAFIAGAGAQANLFADKAFWRDRVFAHYRSGAAFGDLSAGLRLPGETFDSWLKHPQLDAYWRGSLPDAASLARLDTPILTVTGQYDADLPGALAYHRAHLVANPQADHRIVIGPWDHEGTRTPKRHLGDLDLGEAALIDVAELEAAWFDHHCFGRALPPQLREPVSYYVIAPERQGTWRRAASLAAVSRDRWTLWPGRHGALEEAAPAAGAGAFVSDPSRLRPETWIDWLDMEALSDAREIDAIDDDGLVWTAPPLPFEITLTGLMEAELVVSCDGPDADLVLYVDALGPGGRATPLMRVARRLRYAASLEQARAPRPDDVLRIAFDNAAFVARVLEQGTRLRLAVRALNSPWWEKNWQGGGEVARETAADARPARITVHLGAQGTVLRLPLAVEPDA